MSEAITKYVVDFKFDDKEYSMEFDIQEHAINFYNCLADGKTKSVSLKEIKNIMACLRLGESIRIGY